MLLILLYHRILNSLYVLFSETEKQELVAWLPALY